VGYEWDLAKAAANVSKHGISFADALTVFEDERSVTRAEPDLGEERYLTLGMDSLGRILVVVYTWRGPDIRLISARKATRSERAQYAWL
jgi:uncharacterized DUF497 family protein